MAQAGDEEESAGGSGDFVQEKFGMSLDDIFARRDGEASEKSTEDSSNQGEQPNGERPEANKPEDEDGDQSSTDTVEAASGSAAESTDPPNPSWVSSATGKALRDYGLDPENFKDENAALRTIDAITTTRRQRELQAYQEQEALRQRQLQQQQGQPQGQPQAGQRSQLREFAEKVKEVDFGEELNTFALQLTDTIERQNRELEETRRYMDYVKQREMMSFGSAVLGIVNQTDHPAIDKQRLNEVFGEPKDDVVLTNGQAEKIRLLIGKAAEYTSGRADGKPKPLTKESIETLLVREFPELRVNVSAKVEKAKAVVSQAGRRMGTGGTSRGSVSSPTVSRNPADPESRTKLRAKFFEMQK